MVKGQVRFIIVSKGKVLDKYIFFFKKDYGEDKRIDVSITIEEKLSDKVIYEIGYNRKKHEEILMISMKKD
jgi:hypothetical protein